MSHELQRAIADLDDARNKLAAVVAREEFTIKEMRDIRTTLLRTVRNNIDPWALGHAPEKRHY